MLGWEFPPFISGGLGTACEGLTRALARLDTEILFVLPKAIGAEGAGSVSQGALPREESRKAMAFKSVPSSLTSPYQYTGRPREEAGAGVAAKRAALAADPSRSQAGLQIVGAGASGGYEGDLLGRIGDYAQRCLGLARGETFDIVHAHDWVTFPAGAAIAAESGKPLVVQVHSTEFDRSGENVNRPVHEIEHQGMHAAQAIIAVSHMTKRIIVQRYGVPAEKVRVVHNGIDPKHGAEAPRPRNGDKTVLFMGRLTMQKGPEFFVRAAARVLTRLSNVRFIVAGWGDLGPQIVEQVAAMGLGTKVRFAGFLRGAEVEQAYRMADVYVMPSVSEPFGLTALEAIQHGVPVVLSKNSGVAEVLHRGALKVDFWDVEQMADKILAVLRHPALGEAVCRHGAEEIRPLTWDEAARKCVGIYREQVEALKS